MRDHIIPDDVIDPGAKTGGDFMKEKWFSHQDQGAQDDYLYSPNISIMLYMVHTHFIKYVGMYHLFVICKDTG